MGKLKLGRDDFDINELDVEWEDSDYATYDGDIPPNGTTLSGHIKKMWWSYTSEEKPMLKVLFVARDNEGDEKEFDGLPVWENITFTPSAAFRYGPFLEAFGLTLKDVRDKTYVKDEDDNLGAPIEKIATLVPGDEAMATIITGRERYQGEWQARIKKWVMEEDEEDEEEPEDEEEQDDEEETEDEDEEEPESAPKRRATRAAKREHAPTPRGRKPVAKAAAPARRGARRPKAEGYDEEPPF